MAETYLIEVREGSGEPGFIELTPGVELAPLGVGTEGAWRIRAAGVLGVHLYLYFDGQALFAQSADQSKPVVVNGRTVGAAWTPLTAPATIALGTARLFFRPNARDSEDDEDRTIAQAAPSELMANDDSSDDDRTIAQLPPVPQVRTAAPVRPFVPGAFSSRSDESTRFAPIGDDEPDSQSTRVVPLVEGLNTTETPQLGSPAVRSMGPAAQRPGAPVRPAAGVPWSASTGVGAPGGGLGSTAPLVQRTTAPDFERQSDDDSSAQVTRAFNTNAPLPPMPPNDGQQPGPYPRPPGPSAAFPLDPRDPAPPGPPPGLLNVPPPPSVTDPKPAGGRLAREWSAAPTTRKILYVSLLPALAGAFWVILSGNDPPPAQPRANQAGSASAAKSGSAPTGQAPPTPGSTPPPAGSPPTPPPTPPTPPPPGTPPSGPTTAPPAGPSRPPPDPNLPVADAGADADRRERNAADYVATGQYELAAQIYDTLARDNPKNPAFGEAARILRTKADAGIR